MQQRHTEAFDARDQGNDKLVTYYPCYHPGCSMMDDNTRQEVYLTHLTTHHGIQVPSRLRSIEDWYLKGKTPEVLRIHVVQEAQELNELNKRIRDLEACIAADPPSGGYTSVHGFDVNTLYTTAAIPRDKDGLVSLLKEIRADRNQLGSLYTRPGVMATRGAVLDDLEKLLDHPEDTVTDRSDTEREDGPDVMQADSDQGVGEEDEIVSATLSNHSDEYPQQMDAVMHEDDGEDMKEEDETVSVTLSNLSDEDPRYPQQISGASYAFSEDQELFDDPMVAAFDSSYEVLAYLGDREDSSIYHVGSVDGRHSVVDDREGIIGAEDMVMDDDQEEFSSELSSVPSGLTGEGVQDQGQISGVSNGVDEEDDEDDISTIVPQDFDHGDDEDEDSIFGPEYVDQGAVEEEPQEEAGKDKPEDTDASDDIDSSGDSTANGSFYSPSESGSDSG
jgi:hypothetical protein